MNRMPTRAAVLGLVVMALAASAPGIAAETPELSVTYYFLPG